MNSNVVLPESFSKCLPQCTRWLRGAPYHNSHQQSITGTFEAVAGRQGNVTELGQDGTREGEGSLSVNEHSAMVCVCMRI